jgi:ubiquinone/menaquinone biosynthesis C-methylase UbiE
MSTQPFDPTTYKAQQRQNWSSVAEGWKTWWSTMEQGAQPVSDRLVQLSDLQSGQKVLDVATGIGEPAVTAARRIGTTGRVVAIDLAPQMLAVAQERAAELGLQQIAFHEGDAESLDLTEGDFDAILSRWGLMFLPNLPQALGKMKQLLKPGGRLAAAVWGQPSDVPLLSLAMGSMMQVLELPQPPPEAPGPFSLADAAGFSGRPRRAADDGVRVRICRGIRSVSAGGRGACSIGDGGIPCRSTRGRLAGDEARDPALHCYGWKRAVAQQRPLRGRTSS